MIIKPDYNVESLFDISFDALKNDGVSIIMFDLDSTVMPSKSGVFPEKVLELFKRLENSGFTLSIVTNNSSIEYIEKVRKQVDFPVIENAEKPRTEKIKYFLSSLCKSPKEAVIIGDRPLTDILTGKLLGTKTVLVDSITKDTENKLTRFVRALERSVIKK